MYRLNFGENMVEIKQKESQLIEMVCGFCDEKLDEEYISLCVKLIEKLGRKREVPFKRGKLENWASGIIYAIGQINFLFDSDFEPYVTPDEICTYFGTKKSTASNKARDIRQILNLKLGDKEFSTELILNSGVDNIGGDLSQVKSLRGTRNMATLQRTADILSRLSRR